MTEWMTDSCLRWEPGGRDFNSKCKGWVRSDAALAVSPFIPVCLPPVAYLSVWLSSCPGWGGKWWHWQIFLPLCGISNSQRLFVVTGRQSQLVFSLHPLFTADFQFELVGQPINKHIQRLKKCIHDSLEGTLGCIRDVPQSFSRPSLSLPAPLCNTLFLYFILGLFYCTMNSWFFLCFWCQKLASCERSVLLLLTMNVN